MSGGGQALRAAAYRNYPHLVQRRQALRHRAWRTIPAAWRRPFQVVERFDVWEYLATLAAEASAVLAESDIEFLLIPSDGEGMPRLVVRHDDRDAVRTALGADPRTAGCWLAVCRADVAGRAAPVRRRRLPGWATGVIVTRNLVTATGQPLVHSELGVPIEFWRETADERRTPGGGRMLAGTLVGEVPNGVLDHAGPQLWREIQANGHRLPQPYPHLLTVSEPVDLVYTWVDGDDPRWRAAKDAALTGRPDPAHSADAAIAARFTSRDELRYSLRSVEMFASWVRRIWIVTDRQVPGWLRPDDRLRVIDHSEIFADRGALPVFNSHAIESQLHHIPGLANLYLYLNDDMLFGAPVRPEDFFHSNGVAKFFPSRALIDHGAPHPDDIAVTAAAKNNRRFIEAATGRTITNKLRHGPQPQRRDVLERLETEHPDLLDRVMRSRFRGTSDYSLPSSLSHYYGYSHGATVTGGLRHGYVDLASPDAETVLALWSERRDLACLCVNDSGAGDPQAASGALSALKRFFATCYPLPSPWEDDGAALSESAPTPSR